MGGEYVRGGAHGVGAAVLTDGRLVAKGPAPDTAGGRVLTPGSSPDAKYAAGHHDVVAVACSYFFVLALLDYGKVVRLDQGRSCDQLRRSLDGGSLGTAGLPPWMAGRWARQDSLPGWRAAGHGRTPSLDGGPLGTAGLPAALTAAGSAHVTRIGAGSFMGAAIDDGARLVYVWGQRVALDDPLWLPKPFNESFMIPRGENITSLAASAYSFMYNHYW
jgi:hypothetical protein